MRQALFGNVQLGHDLQAADERGVQRAVGLHHLAQRAVHAKAHAGVALVRLNVNVARAIARGLREQRVEHADDGRVVRRLQQVFHGRQLLHDAREVHVRLHFADHGGGAGFALRVGVADALGQRGLVLHLQRQGPLALAVAAQRLAQAGAVAARAGPQGERLAVVFQQQQGRAREGVGQGIAHQSPM